jgi:hypothetical protein
LELGNWEIGSAQNPDSSITKFPVRISISQFQNFPIPMTWYLAKLVYRIICGDGDHMPQFDEQLRLIQAEDELHAFNKAQLTGQREQDRFLNEAERPVQWKFINVTELHTLEELTDGAEVYSRIREEDDGDDYQHMVQVKARYLLEHCTEQFIQSI